MPLRKKSVAIDLSPTLMDKGLQNMALECHKFYTCYKWKYKRNKRLRLILGMTAVGLGVAGGVVTAATANPIPVACISGAGLIVGGFLAKSGVNKKVETCKMAYTMYLKHLRKLNSVLNGMDTCNVTELLAEYKVINEIVIDMCPTVNGMEARYTKLYDRRSGVMEMET